MNKVRLFVYGYTVVANSVTIIGLKKLDQLKKK